MEQLVIILIIGAVSLIKWLMEKSAEHRAAQRSQQRTEDHGEPAAPEAAPGLPDRDTAARKFREALGLPEEFDLPPPIARRPEPAPAPSAPRPAPSFPPPLPRPVQPPERPVPDFTRNLRELERRFAGREEEGPAAPFPVPAKPLMVEPAKKSSAILGLEELLRSREGLRKAVLAQEVLGTPKGLVF